MSSALRIILLIAAIAVVVYLLRAVKRSKMRIEDTVFWVVLGAIILLFAIFPQIVTALAGLLGIASEQNFVFMFFIFVLAARAFFNSRDNSDQETKLRELTQQIALERLDHYERTKKQ
ncbi:MAG: DUF2304 domain-containing protein [Eggerthellaceae bacterium]|nr:DUF2304 domain-containing protein [Eggerthellaceae bacterium]